MATPERCRRGGKELADRMHPAGPPGGGWKQFEDGKYREAVAQYSRAIEIWKSVREPPVVPSAPGAQAEPYTAGRSGGTQLLAGDTKSAIASLDAAIRPTLPRGTSTCARAKEVAGLGEQAIADYNWRAARRSPMPEHGFGEAHLYRGILLISARTSRRGGRTPRGEL
jgi:hypothetical protein